MKRKKQMSEKLRKNVTAAAKKFKTESEFREFINKSDFGITISSFETSAIKKKSWCDAHMKDTFACCVVNFIYGGPCGNEMFPGESRTVRKKFEKTFADNFWRNMTIGTTAVAVLTALIVYNNSDTSYLEYAIETHKKCLTLAKKITELEKEITDLKNDDIDLP